MKKKVGGEIYYRKGRDESYVLRDFSNIGKLKKGVKKSGKGYRGGKEAKIKNKCRTIENRDKTRLTYRPKDKESNKLQS